MKLALEARARVEATRQEAEAHRRLAKSSEHLLLLEGGIEIVNVKIVLKLDTGDIVCVSKHGDGTPFKDITAAQGAFDILSRKLWFKSDDGSYIVASHIVSARVSDEP